MTATLQIKKNRPNYFIVIRYYDDNGKQQQKWVSTDIPTKGNNKREANNRLEEVLAEYKSRKVDLGKDVLFTVFLKEWLEIHKHSIASVTYDTYKLVFYNQIIPFFEKKRLYIQDVEPKQQYVNFKLKTASPNTMRKHLWYMSKCFELAIRQNIVALNPVKRIELPKLVKFTGAKFYNENQIKQLLSACEGDILENVIKLSLFYGTRRSDEIIGIKWDAVDFENNLLTIKHTAVQMGTKIHRNDSTKNSSSYRSFTIPPFIKIQN